MNTETILSLEEATEYLKLGSEAKLRKLCRDNKIAHTKTGRTYTFRFSALTDYQLANETSAIAANPHGLTTRAASRLTRAS